MIKFRAKLEEEERQKKRKKKREDDKDTRKVGEMGHLEQY